MGSEGKAEGMGRVSEVEFFARGRGVEVAPRLPAFHKEDFFFQLRELINFPFLSSFRSARLLIEINDF